MKVVGIVFADIFNTKGIYNDTGSVGSLFVAREARHDDRLVVAGSIEALGEEIIDKLARLRKAVDNFVYLELHPNVASKLVEIVFENEFLRDIRKSNMCVFAEIKGGDHVEVGNVKGCKPVISEQKDYVENELDKFQGDSGCDNISRIAYSIGADGDTVLIGVCFLGLNITD